LRWLIVACLAMWMGLPAVALELQVQLDRESVEVGETVVMQVVVMGTRDGQQRPQVAATPGLALQYAGAVSQMNNNNGRTSVQVVHRYLLKPEVIGDIVIPPITVKVGRETLVSPPQLLHVGPSETHDEPAWLKLVVDRSEVVVGDTFEIELQLYFQSIRDPAAPRFDLDGFVVGRSLAPKQAATSRGGQNWSVVTWRYSVTATKPGQLAIGPVEMDVTLLLNTLPRRAGSIFDEVFGAPRQAQRVTLKSRAHSIRAVAPPAVGRPNGFAGAVGRFRASATVSPAEVVVGDPATVRITVEGEGGIERLELPEWGESAGFRVYPGTNGFTPSDALGLAGTKVFEYVIVPERPGSLSLPLPPLIGFDPDARRYDPVPMTDPVLMVRPSTRSTSGTNPVVGGTPGGSAPTAGTPGIQWRAVGGGKPWLGQGWAYQGWVAGALIFPWLLMGGLGLLDVVQRRRAARPKVSLTEQWRAEARRLEARVKSGQADPAEASRAVRYRLGAWLDTQPEAITSGIVDGVLRERGLGGAECEALESWFEEWEAIRFAPGSAADQAAFLGRTQELLGLLDGMEERA
jgi:hypothetical protein